MSIIQNIENFNVQILDYGTALHKVFMYDNQSAGAINFEEGIHWILPKTEHYEALFLSLPCEIFCFKPVFGTCLYAFSHSVSLHTYEQTQKGLHLDLIVAFLCLLVCMCGAPQLSLRYLDETTGTSAKTQVEFKLGLASW